MLHVAKRLEFKMPLWLQVLLQVLEAVLQALISNKQAVMATQTQSESDYAADVAKLRAAIAALKS